MELIGIQIFTVIFSLFMIYFTYVCYKKKYFGVYTLFAWYLVFLAVIVASLFPNILRPFINFLQLSRLFDLFIVAGILFLITITYINFLFLQKLKNKFEKVVQDKALSEERDLKSH